MYQAINNVGEIPAGPRAAVITTDHALDRSTERKHCEPRVRRVELLAEVLSENHRVHLTEPGNRVAKGGDFAVGQPHHRLDQPDPLFSLGRFAEDVKSVTDLGIPQLAKV